MAEQNRRKFGAENEELAVEFLKNKGFEIIARNFRTPFSEIDIIAKDEKTLVFVEVKARRSYRYGHAVAAVTPQKQRRIIQAAYAYLQQNQIELVDCRFDVIAIHFERGRPLISHFPNAFIDDSYY